MLMNTLVSKQRQYFLSHMTKSIDFRLTQLQKLKQAIIDSESAIYEAVKADLSKPTVEAYISEFAIIVQEINFAIKSLKTWAKPKAKSVSWQLLPAFAKIYPEPLGVVLIIGAWNYPFQLTILPLIGAISAGNCAVIKPSEVAPYSSQLISKIISKNFNREYIAVVEGEIETSRQLLQERFDHIFFTGSTATGKIIMAEAAKHLTPVTLELGGKSPCIVDADVNIEVAARRITWGKFFNAGQSCVAPDYLIVHKDIKEKFLKAIEKCINDFFGDKPINSPDYARIINQKQYLRLVSLLQGNIIVGGETNTETLYIAPTIIDNVQWASEIMQEEIFGPILPVIEYENIDNIINNINSREKPLSLYIFSNNPNINRQIIQKSSSGGVVINDVMKHLFASSLPFGGVGHSGIGSYHGKASFDTFSHYKSVLNRPVFFDLKLLYAPYIGKLTWLKKLLG
jgi:acyl-CoA reductase-like NAD-dependent aldehyde dehydrogenase